MLIFKGPTIEACFRTWYAQQRQRYDAIVLTLTWPIVLLGLRAIWKYSMMMPSSWWPVVILLSVSEKVQLYPLSGGVGSCLSSCNIPTICKTMQAQNWMLMSHPVQVVPSWLLFRHREYYFEHRCLITAFQRVVDMIGSFAYVIAFHEGLGVANAHEESLLHSLHALVIGDGWTCVVHRYNGSNNCLLLGQDR